MGIPRTGWPEQTSQPAPARTPSPGGPEPPLPAKWRVDRLPNGAFRIQPAYVHGWRLVALALIVVVTCGPVFSAFRERSISPGTLLGLILLLALGLVVATWREEWRVRTGDVRMSRGTVGVYQTRTVTGGSFKVGKVSDASSPADSSLSSARWLSVLLIPLGVILISKAMPGQALPFGLDELLGYDAYILQCIMAIAGILMCMLPFMLLSGTRSRPESLSAPPPPSNTLLLRSGTQEWRLPGSELDSATKEFNALAEWFGQQTGWPVEPAEPPSSEHAVSAMVADPPVGVPGQFSSVTLPYEPGVMPALPEGWNAELQPDGSLRVVPSFVRPLFTRAAGAILAPLAVLGYLVARGGAVTPLECMVALAVFVLLLGLSTNEAWILGRDRFEVHRLRFGLWTRKRFDHGAIMVRPQAVSSLNLWKWVLSVPALAVFVGLPYIHRSFIEPMVMRGEMSEQTGYYVLGALLSAPLLAPWLYSAIARSAIIASTSRLYLATVRPGQSRPQIVDLMASNKQSEHAPGWVGSVDDYRALAAWLSEQTGWPVTEVR